jgi:predicted metal-dependent hydrolase
MSESDQSELPLILAFVSDFMASTRIKSTTEKLGYEFRSVENASQIAPGNVSDSSAMQGEPIAGVESILFDKITRWSPVLIICDLGNDEIPWRNWLGLLKSSPATRRLPVVCYGPHVDVEALEEAKALSVEQVLSRSSFFSNMPAIIREHARSDNVLLIEEICLEALPGSAKKGISAFNKGDYFEAHEHLEDAWNEDQSEARDFFRALIQVAVAYLQIERSNYRGAFKMLLRARQWFRPLPDVCHGVNVKSLREDAEIVYKTLVTSDPDKIADFDRSLFRPIQFSGGG